MRKIKLGFQNNQNTIAYKIERTKPAKEMEIKESAPSQVTTSTDRRKLKWGGKSNCGK